MKYVEHLGELEHYEQDSGANITYQFIVRPGTLGLLSGGRIKMHGPTTKANDVHGDWDQVYLVLAGSGSVRVGKKVYRVRPGCVVRIPKNTLHGVSLKKGEKLEYCYFNAFASDAILKRHLKSK